MANKQLKSIKFPGLDDTYIIPDVYGAYVSGHVTGQSPVMFDDGADGAPIKELKVDGLFDTSNPLSITIEAETVLFNQINLNGDFETSSMFAVGNGTVTTENNILSYTVTNVGSIYYENRIIMPTPKYTAQEGHKLLLMCDVRYPRTGDCRLARYRGNTIVFNSNAQSMTPNTWVHISAIYNGTSDSIRSGIHFMPNVTEYNVGDVIKVRNYMCVDLTEMYGEGNEPDTESEFKKDWPSAYYDYTPEPVKKSRAYGKKIFGDYIGQTWTVDMPDGVTDQDLSWDVINGTVCENQTGATYTVDKCPATSILGINNIISENMDGGDFITMTYHKDPTIIYEKLSNAIISLGDNV